MTHTVPHGTRLYCSSGRAPGLLLVSSARPVTCGHVPVARVCDHLPGRHLTSFGTCLAGGLPRPCAPLTPAPWHPGAGSVLVDGEPALTTASTLPCVRGGVIVIGLSLVPRARLA